LNPIHVRTLRSLLECAEYVEVSIGRTLGVFRLRRVKWKIMLPFLVLTSLFALFATKNVTELVTSSLEDRLNGQLVSASQYAADAMAKKERDHLEVLRTVAHTEGVAEAIAREDSAELEDLVLPAVANTAAEHVELFDRAALSVYGVRDAATPGSRVSLPLRRAPTGWTPVRDVLAGKSDANGDKFVAVVEDDGAAWLLSASPVRDASGQLAGAVVVASRLDGVLLDVKRNAFAETTVFSLGSSPVSSTLDLADASEENGYFRGAGATGQPGSIGSGEVLGRSYHFMTSPLVLRGEPIGTLSVALPVDSVIDAGEATRIRMAGIFAVIALGVVLIGWAVARHLTSPLTRLVEAAVAVSDGDLSARSNVRTGDEIGVLGASFDSMADRLERQHIATIAALASAIDARDPYTAGHSVRVGDLSAELGEAMGMAKPVVQHLRVGGLLHDIGKIGVADKILLKPGTLTPDERRMIEQHPTIGLRILESAQLPTQVLEIVGGHHERLDGSGYPLGLSADEISIFPRVTAVADVYDAMTTDRPYRAGLSPQEALRLLWRQAEEGILDPEVVATMRRIARLWEEKRASEVIRVRAWMDSLDAARRGSVEAA